MDAIDTKLGVLAEDREQHATLTAAVVKQTEAINAMMRGRRGWFGR